MRKLSKLGSLSSEDQKVIFDLCTRHTYPEIVNLVSKPRSDGGLDLETNPTALCRFNQEYGWFAGNSKLVQQFADILSVQVTPDLPDHIFTLIQRQVFLALARGRDIDNMKFQLRLYEKLLRFHLRQSRSEGAAPISHSRVKEPASQGNPNEMPPEMAAALAELVADFSGKPPRSPQTAPNSNEPTSKTGGPASSQIPMPPIPALATSNAPVYSTATSPSPAPASLATLPPSPKCSEKHPAPNFIPFPKPLTEPLATSAPELYLPSVIDTLSRNTAALAPNSAVQHLNPSALSAEAHAIISRQVLQNPRNFANFTKIHTT